MDIKKEMKIGGGQRRILSGQPCVPLTGVRRWDSVGGRGGRFLLAHAPSIFPSLPYGMICIISWEEKKLFCTLPAKLAL